MSGPSQTITDLERALYVVDRSGAAELLEEHSRTSNRGCRRQGLTPRLYLVLQIVAAGQGKVTVRDMHDIATEQLPDELQWRLGIRRRSRIGTVAVLSDKQLYKFGQALTRHLGTDLSEATVTGHDGRPRPLTPEEAEAELERRRRVRVEVGDRLVKASHPFPMVGTSLAVDETGVWSWARGKKKPDDMPPVDPVDEDARAAAQLRKEKDRLEAQGKVFLPQAPDGAPDIVDEDAEPEVTADAPGDHPASDTGEGEDAVEASRPYCPDARWSTKTHKNGKQSSFFGFFMNTLVRVPDVVAGQVQKDTEPLLIERMRLTPAGADIVASTLEMLDQLADEERPVRDLLGDRHYSYKKFDRWARQLWRRLIHPVLDLRKTDHGTRDYEGMTFIDGWPHCPAMPVTFQTLERPGVMAPKEAHDKFKQEIAKRAAYAMSRNKTPYPDGRTQWGCPALDGKVGCPLREDTVENARKYRLPIITNPPAEPGKPCTQKLVLVPPSELVKYVQDDYWGSDDWYLSYGRRSYVEGVFGNLKNPNTENIHRGFIQMVGITNVTLAMAAAAVSYNIREYNNWLERTGQESDLPLARETEWQHGFSMHNGEEREAIDREWLERGDEETE